MVYGILLAAGRSLRFGADKRLAPLINGLPMTLHTALRWQEAMDNQLLVILRSEDEKLASLLTNASIAYTHCPLAILGIGHSLSHGVHCTDHAAGWVIGLADMPRVKPDSIAAVARAIKPGRIVVPMIQSIRGHPVGFDAMFGPELCDLNGDTGAKKILVAHSQSLHHLELNDPGILYDVDRVDDISDCLY
jgi:molybdenum cofactor cytidylyltransferase